MPHAPIEVRSDNPEVTTLLRYIAEITRSRGATIHPSATIVEADGDLRVECARGVAGSALFAMPSEVLPEVSLGQWDWARDDLVLNNHQDADPVKTELLRAHCALYNATGKGRWFRHHHPRAVLAESEELTEVVKLLKPGFAPDASANGFLRTRVLGVRNRSSPTSATSEPILMPLIDCLNNHARGAPFKHDHGIRVRVAQPTGTSECFASYGKGRSDPLGLALNYGYLDTSKSDAVSAPVSVVIEAVGHVEIGGPSTNRRSPLDPPALVVVDGGLRLSHLTFQRDNPQRLLIPLRMALTAIVSPTVADTASRDLLIAVAMANLALLYDLKAAIRSSGVDRLDVLLDAADAQESIIRSCVRAVD